VLKLHRVYTEKIQQARCDFSTEIHGHVCGHNDLDAPEGYLFKGGLDGAGNELGIRGPRSRREFEELAETSGQDVAGTCREILFGIRPSRPTWSRPSTYSALQESGQ